MYIMQKDQTKQIKNYIISDKLIGAGKQGKVYIGQKVENGKKLHTLYAIKIIPKFNNADAQAHLTQEVNVGQTCDHPNLMKVYELCSTYENYFLITEYCPMGSLKNYIALVKPNEEEAIRLLKGICSGYNELYNNNIVHCDMKTDNILLAENKGTIIPKISDFGCAKKLYELSMSMTKIELNNADGTPLYMSPQTLNSDSHNYQTDIFSIGSIFYEILFGIHPFEGTTLGSIQKLLHKGDFYMDTTRISKESAKFILGCLHFDEKERYHIKDIMTNEIFIRSYKELTKFEEPDKKAKFSIHSLSVDE